MFIWLYLLFATQSQILATLRKAAFKYILGKGENAGKLVTSILSFSQNDFYPSQNKFQLLSQIFYGVFMCFHFGQV